MLDLRRPELQRNLILRHRLHAGAPGGTSTDRGFLEIETPILTKPTPEGARDYLVPSRVHPGEFYALPQSPQIYKQLLMVAGFDRYFQIARCFRDEDLRADRQPEFTQIDIEASFVGAEDIQRVASGCWAISGRRPARAWRRPFPRMRYAEAMERYGIDKPDLRYGLEIFDLTPLFGRDAAPSSPRRARRGGRVRGICVPGGAALTRKQLDEIEAAAQGSAGGRAQLAGGPPRLGGPGRQGSAPRLLRAARRLPRATCLARGGPGYGHVSPALDAVRQDLARRLGTRCRRETHAFSGSCDFPLFEKDPADWALHAGAPPVHRAASRRPPAARDDARRRAARRHYDVGATTAPSWAAGIRITDPRCRPDLRAARDRRGEIRRRFGFLLEGSRPARRPHGGIAFGFDRIAMLLAGARRRCAT